MNATVIAPQLPDCFNLERKATTKQFLQYPVHYNAQVYTQRYVPLWNELLPIKSKYSTWVHLGSFFRSFYRDFYTLAFYVVVVIFFLKTKENKIQMAEFVSVSNQHIPLRRPQQSSSDAPTDRRQQRTDDRQAAHGNQQSLRKLKSLSLINV